ncbi:MAG: hypothetical protein HQM14_17995 [SAR324 cluster bacterium]|nr:hypothetical protein [SAR324 cluster bacterium]
MNFPYDPFTKALRQIGLNMTGVASGKSWQKIVPHCQSVLVYGSGGSQLWESFLEDLKQNSEHLTKEPHPLDAFIQRTLTGVDPDSPQSRRWVRCAANEETFADFRILGHQAGLGHPSKLGLLINSEFGPWFGLRLACFTSEYAEPTGPLSGASPCESCDAPCISACPAEAISATEGLDLKTCSMFHDLSEQCRQTCHAREACPEGKAHMYVKFQRQYHYDNKLGRMALGQYLGIPFAGEEVRSNWSDQI